MTGNTPKCLMMVSNKGQDEIEAIAPENFTSNIQQNGIYDKSNVTMYEISKIPTNVDDDEEFDEEGGEGGEDENEEMEDGSAENIN